MNTREALDQIVPLLGDELVIHTTGFICRDSCAAADRPGNFYMIGSMGLAPSIGLGLAMSRPQRRIVVFDGDGALLMAMGTLAMVARENPKNFYHLVFDNEAYASTGHQPTHSRHVDLDKIALASGYAHVLRADKPEQLKAGFLNLVSKPGPGFLLIKCINRSPQPGARIVHEPSMITRRVREAVGT
ncbi:MAG: sulfopyruvate decarboxylase subunit beta [Candidatus Omnitrophica bacterium]|nr:sulfopyruvate decarboxylase subunit beta [Candidatus Omnitrophota bacterium]